MKVRKKNKLVLGVGINDADYRVQEKVIIGKHQDGRIKQKSIWACSFYKAWYGILSRCYSVASLKRTPTYNGCTVCEEWLTFSKFKAWMETQDWQGKALDKDILVYNNKVYSPSTCTFVTTEVNSFFVDLKLCSRGKVNLPGVSWHKRDQKFTAQVSTPEKLIHLGYHITAESAYNAWLSAKRDLAENLANLQDDKVLAKAIRDYYWVNYDYKT